MTDFNRNILVIIYLLKKLHRQASKRQQELFYTKGNNEIYRYDVRITSFGLVKMIIYCAINDCYALRNNIGKKTYLSISREIDQVFDEQIVRLAIENYPIYNYIIRFQSIIETGTRKLPKNLKFETQLSKLNDNYKSAEKILKAWRNTIHNNGHLAKKQVHSYRGKEVIIPDNGPFKFEFWTLYRISFDLIEVLFEFCKDSFNNNPDLLTDNSAINESSQKKKI